MSVLEKMRHAILGATLDDFQARRLSISDLKNGYDGILLKSLKEANKDYAVEFELALEELENSSLIETGPFVPYENDPNSGIFIMGGYSARQTARLTEGGYKLAINTKTNSKPTTKKATPPSDAKPLYGIHPIISEKCGALYETGELAAAVERSFKIVRERLRKLTGHETGSDAFGNGLHVKGAAEPHVDNDFNNAVKFLTMAIDKFRNEKAHTVDGNIEDPVRAHQYLSLSSLALGLLEQAEVIKK